MIQENVLLKEKTHYKIGGPAKFFLTAQNTEELLTDLAKIQNEPIFVLGAGTNVLASDNGFDGAIINPDFKSIEADSDKIKVGAGVSMTDLNQYCIDHALSGLEWSGGLPGTLGGAVFGNAGAFGGETKDNVLSVESLDLKTKKAIIRSNEECQFGYRTSIFKTNPNKEIILFVTISTKPGNKTEVEQAIQEKIDYRKARQPLDLPSAGSTFKNVPIENIPTDVLEKFKDKQKNDPFPVIPAAVFLADAELMGKTVGGAQVSTVHPNFIVNTGQAVAADVKKLIKEIIAIIKEKYGVVLEPEIIQI